MQLFVWVRKEVPAFRDTAFTDVSVHAMLPGSVRCTGSSFGRWDQW
jgi:hypothetical protein